MPGASGNLWAEAMSEASGWNAPLPQFVDLPPVAGGISSTRSVYPLAPQQRFAGSPRPAAVPPTPLGGAHSNLVVAPGPPSALRAPLRLAEYREGARHCCRAPIPRPILRATLQHRGRKVTQPMGERSGYHHTIICTATATNSGRRRLLHDPDTVSVLPDTGRLGWC